MKFETIMYVAKPSTLVELANDLSLTIENGNGPDLGVGEYEEIKRAFELVVAQLKNEFGQEFVVDNVHCPEI